MKLKMFSKSFALSGLLLTTLVPIMASAQNSVGGNVSQEIPIQTASQASNSYWSVARMRAAKPFITQRTGSHQKVSKVASSSGAPVSAPSGRPNQTQTSTQMQDSAPVTVAAATQAAGYSYPYPYTRYFVRSKNYTNYPEATIGKLYFTMATGGDYVCSASAVNSTGKRLIVTAGHCVSDGAGHFHKNVIFVPAYNPTNTNPNQREPYGRWSGCELFTRMAWHTKSDFSQDIGMIEACDNSGKKLHDTVGYLGFLANASRTQHWHDFGYPQASPFDGTKMTVCAASWATDDSGSPNPFGIGCDMTGGASGGPFVVKYSPDGVGSTNQINGVNSYKYGSEPESIYSPYFGQEFLDLRNYAISKGA